MTELGHVPTFGIAWRCVWKAAVNRHSAPTFVHRCPGLPELHGHTSGRAGNTETLALADAPEKADKPAVPGAAMPDQITGVREALQGLGEASPEQVARRFKRGRAKTVEPLLETLAALGQARKLMALLPST